MCGFVSCGCVLMCGFRNVCVCVAFLIYGCVYVCVFCNVRVYVWVL
jgi:hypothetical protein